MTERDKLLPCPFCGSEPRHLEHKAGFYRERVICDSCEFHLPPEAWNLRALAAQQPEAVEHPLDGPKCEHGYPLSAPSCPLCGGRPQASAPADHTARGMQGQTGPVATPYIPTDHTAEVIATPPYFCSDGDRCHNLLNEALCAKQCQRLMPAAPAEADLDALVADDAFTLDHADDEVHSLRKFFGDNDATAKLFEDAIAIYKQRITDLRAQLADKDAVQGTFESYAQIVAEHSANITRLESENAEARELLTNAVRLSSTLEGAELYSAINSFLAKQGDTPKEQARDWCTDADNCRRCKAFVQGELPHAGIPL